MPFEHDGKINKNKNRADAVAHTLTFFDYLQQKNRGNAEFSRREGNDATFVQWRAPRSAVRRLPMYI